MTLEHVLGQYISLLRKSGGPRPMKMSTMSTLWHYDKLSAVSTNGTDLRL